MNSMSSLDVYAITQELQGLIGYRVDNIYKDLADKFFLFKFKGLGEYKNPFLLIEPGMRIHLTEIKHPVSERPSDKIMALRRHLKGTEVIAIYQIDFDRLIKIILKGKQEYHVYVELFGNRPNFIVVDEDNRIIYALWYKKMRHRDLLPGQKFELPPSRGKSILDMNIQEIRDILCKEDMKDDEIVRTLARKTGGGGKLMEEILYRSKIPKNTKNSAIDETNLTNIIESINQIKLDLDNLSPSLIIDQNETPTHFQPIPFTSISGNIQHFNRFSSALDYYYSSVSPPAPIEIAKSNQYRKKLLKVLESQKKTLQDFEWKKKHFKELGDKIYIHFDSIDELLSTILNARKKNIPWTDIEQKLFLAKEKGLHSAIILDEICSERASVRLQLDGEIIEVDFRKSASDIANEFYERAKKAARKIGPAKEAILDTEKKIDSLDEDITEKTLIESVTLKRRKRKWYEKYHWTFTQNDFLIIAGRDISSNEEVAKRRMKDNDLFFHAELQGAPYTVLIRDSSEKEITKDDHITAAQLAAVFSSGWKAGYGAIDVYYVPATSVSFTAPSGEYIPKGGIMVRGSRNYIRGIELSLAIGFQINEFNATVIYGSEQKIRQISPITVIIKPGSISKGKIAKQIQSIFVKKTSSPEDRAKLNAIDLNEFVRAIPHDSMISRLEIDQNAD